MNVTTRWTRQAVTLVTVTLVTRMGAGCGGGDPPADAVALPVPPESPKDYTTTTDTVLDNVTGLMWERNVTATTFTAPDPNNPGAEVKQAADHCATVSAGGFSDWHLPSRLELLFLTDHTVANPAINGATFPATPPEVFWTSTRAAVGPTVVFAVAFGDGAVTYDGDIGSGPVHARCVRVASEPGPAPEALFTVENETARDERTGLVWQQKADATVLYPTSEEAAAYCAGLALGGFSSGWRLPGLKELATLIDDSRAGPAIAVDVFPDTQSTWYWSSTPYVPLGGYSWAISFGDGASYINVSGSGHARCVR
jgi:hypothetical protein